MNTLLCTGCRQVHPVTSEHLRCQQCHFGASAPPDVGALQELGAICVVWWYKTRIGTKKWAYAFSQERVSDFGFEANPMQTVWLTSEPYLCFASQVEAVNDALALHAAKQRDLRTAPIDLRNAKWKREVYNGNPPHSPEIMGWTVYLHGPATNESKLWLKANGFFHIGQGRWGRADA